MSDKESFFKSLGRKATERKREQTGLSKKQRLKIQRQQKARVFKAREKFKADKIIKGLNEGGSDDIVSRLNNLVKGVQEKPLKLRKDKKGPFDL